VTRFHEAAGPLTDCGVKVVGLLRSKSKVLQCTCSINEVQSLQWQVW